MNDKELLKTRLEQFKEESDGLPKKRFKVTLTIIVCIVCFFFGYFANGFLNQNRNRIDPSFDKFFAAYSMMMNDFYFGKDDETLAQRLMDGAITGMVNAGEDPHTQYMVPDIALDFSSSMDGNVTGIGVSMIGIDNSAFIITNVAKDSPALKAGVKAGDMIVEVEGVDAKSYTTDELIERVTGAENTDVNITFLRGNTRINKTITRQKVAATVFSQIKDDIAIMEITSFSQTSGKEVGLHLEDIKKANCNKLIIDLRNNTGGYLSTACDIAAYFFGENQVVLQEQLRDGKVNKVLTTKGLPQYQFETICVLINGNSASASEALCGALMDHLNAKVIGTKSYGKGTVQYPVSFQDGSILKYTTAQWFTPNGTEINEVGITPSYIVEQEVAYETGMPKLDEDEVYEADTVNIAARAVQTYLKYLGYDVDRVDEYFAIKSSEALKKFQKAHNLRADGKICNEVCVSLFSEVIRKFNEDPFTKDLQLKKAISLCQ